MRTYILLLEIKVPSPLQSFPAKGDWQAGKATAVHGTLKEPVTATNSKATLG